jgi:tripartite-type tricarboxylate transporter receptor subunit TctC
VRELSGTADVIDKLHNAGAAPVIQTIPEMNAFWENDTKNMVELIKAAKIKIE